MSEIATILSRLWTLRRWLAVLAVLALLVGIASVYKVSLSPPSLEERGSVRGVASSEVLVDTETSTLTNAGFDIGLVAARAAVFVRFIDTPDVRLRIAEQLGIDPAELAITVYAQRTGGLPVQNPTPGQRAETIADEVNGYRVEAFAQEGLPVMTFRVAAPDGESARQLATAAGAETVAYLKTLGDGRQSPSIPRENAEQDPLLQQLDLGQISFRQLGAPQPSEITIGGVNAVRGVGVFMLVFFVLAVVLLFADGLIRELRVRRRSSEPPAVSTASNTS